MEVRKFVVATLLLAMFLSGCTEEPPQPTEATQESQTEQTGQTQGTEPSETTEVTQPDGDRYPYDWRLRASRRLFSQPDRICGVVEELQREILQRSHL